MGMQGLGKFTLLTVLCGLQGLGKFTLLTVLCGDAGLGKFTLLAVLYGDAGLGRFSLFNVDVCCRFEKGDRTHCVMWRYRAGKVYIIQC